MAPQTSTSTTATTTNTPRQDAYHQDWRRAREEIGATIASFGFCTIIYLFMKRIYSIYEAEIHRENVKALELHWEVHL